MAVSKRLRYEILRRDNHTCRYCGATAPDVPLRVDHVIPVSLGGPDHPSNLVTACQDCNAGKTSSLPNAATVEDVPQDIFRQAAARKRPTHDPETGMPTCWSFRDIELALIEDAWNTAWRAADPEGPSLSDWEALCDQRQQLADRGVPSGNMLAAAVMAGARLSTDLTWGVPSRIDRLWPSKEEFGLGCDVVFAWETAWEEAANERPSRRAETLFFEEVTAAIKAGHGRDALLEAARAAGGQQGFYLPIYLPEIQAAGGGAGPP